VSELTARDFALLVLPDLLLWRSDVVAEDLLSIDDVDLIF